MEHKTILIVLVIAVGIFALMMAALGLKMLLHKEKEFKRPCANADPKTGRCANCTCDLKNKRKHLPAAACRRRTTISHPL